MFVRSTWTAPLASKPTMSQAAPNSPQRTKRFRVIWSIAVQEFVSWLKPCVQSIVDAVNTVPAFSEIIIVAISGGSEASSILDANLTLASEIQELSRCLVDTLVS